jgi:hypothetical protein
VTTQHQQQPAVNHSPGSDTDDQRKSLTVSHHKIRGRARITASSVTGNSPSSTR